MAENEAGPREGVEGIFGTTDRVDLLVLKLQDGTEHFRCDADGNFYIRGEFVASRPDVVDAFCDFFHIARASRR